MVAVETHDVRAPRRVGRWLRFSLRTFLVGVTLLVVGFGTFVTRVENERRAAEAIAKAGGRIVYDWQVVPPDAPRGFKPQPPGPAWLRERLGSHWFDSIVQVMLNGYYRPHAREHYRVASRQLARLPALRELSVWGQELNHEDYVMLGSLTQVEILRLRLDQEIREDDARALAQAAGLKELQIDKACISPSTLRQFARLPRLETLRLSRDAFDPKAVKPLTDWQLDDEAAAAIATLRGLRNLSIYAAQITDAGVADLCRLSQLEGLVVSSPHVTSASFEPIARLERLESLGIWQWQIDDADIVKLAGMPKLRSLDLLTQLSNASVPMVTALPHVRGLRMRGECISDASLPYFHGMSRLERLDLSDTSVDKLGPAVAELKRALPNCVIRLPKTKKEIEMKAAFNAWKWGGMQRAVSTSGGRRILTQPGSQPADAAVLKDPPSDSDSK